MAKIKGICKNIDNCDLAAKEIVQEAEKSNFVCSECGKELKPIATPPPPPPIGKILAILAGVALVGGLVYFFLAGGSKDSEATPDTPAETAAAPAGTAALPIDSTATASPIPADSSTTTQATAIPETGTQDAPAAGTTTAPAGTPKQTSKTTASNKLDLGYATYEGDIANGQPHGNGTLYFKQNHLIPGTVNVQAGPNEKVIGSFRNGKINMGTWYQANGNETIVKAGSKL